MAVAMDRSKYRNPDMPVGYVKKNPKLIYKYGVEIDGVHYIYAPYIFDAHIEERDDYATLSEFIESEDEEITTDVVRTVSENPGPSTSKEVQKETVTIKEEPEFGGTKKKVIKHSKKGQAKDDASILDQSHQKRKKRKDRRSDSSDSDRSFRRSQYSSRSPSPEDVDVKIKQEPFGDSQLFGSYICSVCNIVMNSQLTYDTHVNGKRHRKNLKVKNVSQAVAENIPSTISDGDSKYPKPPFGVIRKKVQKTAEIQHLLEKCIKRPCPGLNYVTEIQGISCTQYYCSMCDSVCSSNSIVYHLTGYKHQLNSVKIFKPGTHERIQNEPKFKIEREIVSILRAVQKKDGMGRMAVEVEELEDQNVKHNRREPVSSRDCTSQPSTSRGTGYEHSTISNKFKGMTFQEKYLKTIIPNTSSSDFYCELCQSHMNSLAMWEAHTRGKRHLANLKKMPGDMPSKTKTVAVKNKKAYILDKIKTECTDEPIVGLREVRETEIHETNSHTYQCFLCGSCHTTLDIIEHLISLKHRTKYLEYIDFEGKEVIYGMSDVIAYPLVRDMCIQVVAREGSGEPEVHVSKSSLLH